MPEETQAREERAEEEERERREKRRGGKRGEEGEEKREEEGTRGENLNSEILKMDYLLAIGRLTRQKNFSFLIKTLCWNYVQWELCSPHSFARDTGTAPALPPRGGRPD